MSDNKVVIYFYDYKDYEISTLGFKIVPHDGVVSAGTTLTSGTPERLKGRNSRIQHENEQQQVDGACFRFLCECWIRHGELSCPQELQQTAHSDKQTWR